MVVEYKREIGSVLSEDELNHLGQQGWQLLAVDWKFNDYIFGRVVEGTISYNIR